jgi:hypothetical protein
LMNTQMVASAHLECSLCVMGSHFQYPVLSVLAVLVSPES